MRVGELEALSWGDLDEPRGRWRIATSKTGRPRWVTPPLLLLDTVLDLCPREDRHPDRRVFEGFTSERFRTALTRACTAAGVPAFSPHDLRHRRVSLLHLGGMPWARIGELVGHDDLVTTARTYTHVVADEREIAKDPELARRYLRAWAKGQDWAIKNQKAAVEAMRKHAPELNATEATANLAELARISQSPDTQAHGLGWQDVKVWAAQEQFMREQNLIATQVDVSKAVTNEYLPKK